MTNYRITDKYGQTAVVLGHTAEHAAERCYKMYLMRAVKIEPHGADAAGGKSRRAKEDNIMKYISTSYDTVAARIDGVEYIALPVYEDAVIRVFRLPSGGADAIRGLLTLPNDAAEVYAASMAGIPNAEAVYAECERILREEIAG